MTDAQFEELKAQNAALRSDMNARFDKVDARFEQVDHRLDRMDARFDQIDRRLDQVDRRFDQVDARLDQMDARFDQMDARLDQMDARLDQMDARLDQMDARFDKVDQAIEKNTLKIGLMFETQDVRFGGIESTLSAVEFGQEEMRNDIRSIKDDVHENSGLLKRIEARVDSLDAHFDSLFIDVRTGHRDHEDRLRVLER